MDNKIINKSLRALLALTIFSIATLSAPKASADTSTIANVSVTVPSVCSLTANPDFLTKIITTYPGNSNIGASTIKAVCNDPAGLAVYAVGYTNDTYGNNKLVNTVGGNNIEIRSYVTSSGTTPSQSEWNMTLTAVSGDYIPSIVTNFDSAHEIPSTYTKVAYRNSVTDMGNNATGANFTANFNAYVTESQAAGIYNGKVKFLLVHPNILDNSTVPPTEAPSTLSYDPETTMQGWGGCTELASIGDTTTLFDTRDWTEYSVAKLADGKCWMTRNLRLNLSEANITDDNTNNPAAGFAAAAMETQPTNEGSGNNIYSNSDRYEIRYSTDHIDDETVDYYGNTFDEYGIHYNWYTATAGNGTSDVVANNTNVAGDICPKNWHLPTENDVNSLLDSIHAIVGYGPDAVGEMMRSATYNFVYSGRIAWGYISYTGANNGTTYGIYWTSTAHTDNNAASLTLTPSSFAPLSWQRSQGSSVRCIAD